MEPFTDYYAILGVNETASSTAIKAAFKKLALQYHPDVYKGADAQERMRALLLAYQTLSDETARRAYDARRSEHFLDKPGRRVRVATETVSDPGSRASAWAKRDRQRRYDFPTLHEGMSAQVDLGAITYQLSPEQAEMLLHNGMLRGVEEHPRGALSSYLCHRCHHQWTPAPTQGHLQPWEEYCPACQASDWAEYLLLRCIHCTATFESEQIRDEVGSLQYGDDSLCPPYELFPLCPYCGTAHWCPVEDTRVSALRAAAAAQRAARRRLLWLGLAVAAALVVGAVVLVMLR